MMKLSEKQNNKELKKAKEDLNTVDINLINNKGLQIYTKSCFEQDQTNKNISKPRFTVNFEDSLINERRERIFEFEEKWGKIDIVPKYPDFKRIKIDNNDERKIVNTEDKGIRISYKQNDISARYFEANCTNSKHWTYISWWFSLLFDKLEEYSCNVIATTKNSYNIINSRTYEIKCKITDNLIRYDGEWYPKWTPMYMEILTLVNGNYLWVAPSLTNNGSSITYKILFVGDESSQIIGVRYNQLRFNKK